MMSSRKVLGLLLIGVAVMGGLVASCGPEEKFCPDRPDGVCLKPAMTVDAGRTDTRADTRSDRRN